MGARDENVFPVASAAGMTLLLVLLPSPAWSHGVLGKRFLPTTLAIEDPFAQDELSFVVNHIKEPGEEGDPPTIATEIEAEYAKRITPHFAISLEGGYAHLDPDGEASIDGFGNLEVAAKWQLFTSAAHEAVVSLGLGVEVGDTGDADAEADDFSTISPALFFGKGLGDLPDAAWYLRPLAVTGALSANFPTDAKTAREGEVERNPVTLDWGFAFLYDLHYLQSHVRDVGLRAPANRLIATVELAFNSCLNRGCGGNTTGTVNPGLIWVGKSFQLGLEAQIPVNDRTGDNVGVLFLVHFFIDDLFPNTLGRPLFGGRGDE